MLFGQSVFQSVLERLKAEEGEEDDEAGDQPAAYRVRGFATGLAFDVMEGVSAAGAQKPGQAYFDNLEFEAPPPAPETPVAEPEPVPEPEPEPVMPEHLSRTAPADIAVELAISSTDTVQSLGEKRRAFAKANHPDRVLPQFRDNATRRMTLANLLIDEAVRRLSR
jgi:type IV secretory pathway VirB10-like protein